MNPTTSDFTGIIKSLRKGAVEVELCDKLGELVRQVVFTGKKGGLKLELVVLPEGIGRVTIGAAVEIKQPKLSTGHTLLFATEDGRLLVDDPRQSYLPLDDAKIVEMPVAPLSQVG